MPTHDEAAAGAELDSIYQRLRQLGSMLDRSQFDPGALLEALDFDAGQIVDYVRQEIRFQAYAGVLRGAEGTLISRSGNALDQSLLLAKLLKDAGYDARIARGRLSRTQARALVGSMAGANSWPSAFGSGDKMEGVMSLLSLKSPLGAQDELLQLLEHVHPVSADRDEQIRSVNQALQKALTQMEAGFPGATFEEELLAEQEDYFWVEYRLNSPGKWQAAHPAFLDSELPSAQVAEYFTDEIPAELQHRVRFQVFVETTLGKKSSVQPLMSPWERPAANAAHIPQTLMLMPVSEFEHDGIFDLEAGLADAKFFGLYLNGTLAPGANVFTLDGLVGPPDALTGQGAFIAEVAGKGKKAADALSALGTSESKAAGGLSRLWFEFSVIEPGGEVSTVSRDVLTTTPEGQRLVLGRPASAESWEEQAKLALAQSREFVVSTGPVSPAFSLGKNLSDVESARKTIEGLQQLEKQGRLSADPKVLKDLEPLPNFRIFDFLAMANGSTGFESDGTTYLARPMIATFNRGISEKNGDLRQFEQTDIVFNARRSVKVDDQSIQRSSQRSALQGVWDTYLETVSSGAPRKPAEQSSAFSLLATHNDNFRYVSPSQVSELGDLALEPWALLLAKNELESGYGLILPEDISRTEPVWWRVDPKTGSVSGMMAGPGGYGGATAAEYLLYLSIGVATLLMYWSFYNCWQNESGLALFCCLVDSWLTGMIVALIAFVIGQLMAAGTAAGAIAAGMRTATATKEAEMVAAIIAAFALDVPSGLISFTDFRIRACGTATGSG
jgi:hypothetical protein